MAITARAVAVLAFALLTSLVLRPSGVVITVLVLVWTALIGLDALLAASPRRLRWEREPVPATRLGERVSQTMVISNESARTLRAQVRDAWQPSAAAQPRHQRVVLPGGERVRISTTLTPQRRGTLHAPGVVVRSLGPLGLACRQRQVSQPATVRVLPPFTSRRHLPSLLARLRDLDGRSSVRTRGQGTEFDSLRDYVEGDDVRAIDWRASARRQQVVVRTWRPERDRRVVIVLDTSRTSAVRLGDETRLDTGLEVALLLAAVASHAGDRVDLITFDNRLGTIVRSSGRQDLLARMVNAMTSLQPRLVEADWGVAAAAIADQVSHRALVVLVTALDSAAIDEGLLPVLPRLTSRHLVMVAGVRDPSVAEMAAQRGDTSALFQAAAAERELMDQAMIGAELARAGAVIVSADPTKLPVRTVDRYLDLKAAGRL